MRTLDHLTQKLLCITYTLLGLLCWQGASASTIDPDLFESAFMASYGVNAAIEPELTDTDKALYKKVLPLLQKAPQRAIDLIKSARSQSAAISFLLGNLYYQMNQLESAQEALEEAIEQMPDFRRAHRTLALIHIHEAALDDAILSWRKVIQLGGGDAQSYGLLGYALLQKQHYESAMVAYQNARMFAPKNKHFREAYAQCLLAIGQSARAIALLDELIEANPTQFDYWLLQANAFIETERHTDAIHNLQHVHSQNQLTYAGLLLLGDLLLNEGLFKPATQAYLESLKKGEATLDKSVKALQKIDSHNERALANQYLHALRTKFGKVVDRQAAVILINARMHLSEGNTEVAIQELSKLCEKDPLNGEALLLLAKAYLQDDDETAARLQLERAAMLESHRTQAYLAITRIYTTNGKLRKAQETLKTALRHDPNSKNIASYLKQIEDALHLTP